eukprot:CAMPEP_0173058460 /NCGR_PEP_ID=MMETSP1102-20130122/1363_1 /TAXON_ID=49646 /ORGANISM="Geminigera sp., Strain Caron Lab Isolate" /LENGTH=115 /DNA_ID=CAMNT_0013924199 /DNA_START=760 /DNA_END=1107 /DNA_ORIENTATION=+
MEKTQHKLACVDVTVTKYFDTVSMCFVMLPAAGIAASVRSRQVAPSVSPVVQVFALVLGSISPLVDTLAASHVVFVFSHIVLTIRSVIYSRSAAAAALEATDILFAVRPQESARS